MTAALQLARPTPLFRPEQPSSGRKGARHPRHFFRPKSSERDANHRAARGGPGSAWRPAPVCRVWGDSAMVASGALRLGALSGLPRRGGEAERGAGRVTAFAPASRRAARTLSPESGPAAPALGARRGHPQLRCEAQHPSASETSTKRTMSHKTMMLATACAGFRIRTESFFASCRGTRVLH